MFLQVSGTQCTSVSVTFVSELVSVRLIVVCTVGRQAFYLSYKLCVSFDPAVRIVERPAHCCVQCLQTSALPLAAMFGMCALFLAGCALCQRQLARIVEVEDKQFELSDSNVNLLSTGNKTLPEV